MVLGPGDGADGGEGGGFGGGCVCVGIAAAAWMALEIK